MPIIIVVGGGGDAEVIVIAARRDGQTMERNPLKTARAKEGSVPEQNKSCANLMVTSGIVTSPTPDENVVIIGSGQHIRHQSMPVKFSASFLKV